MWLVVVLLALSAAIAAFVLLKRQRRTYKLGLLVLMLAGTFVMVLVDHVIAFLEEGTFLEVATDGLIKNGVALGLAMIAPLIGIWGLLVVASRRKARHASRES